MIAALPLELQHLSRTHQVVRLQRALDVAHHRYRVLSMLADEMLYLADPHAVLAGAGAVHGEGARDETLVDRLRFLQLARFLRIERDTEVEIAIAHVAGDHDRERRRPEILLRFHQAFRE